MKCVVILNGELEPEQDHTFTNLIWRERQTNALFGERRAMSLQLDTAEAFQLLELDQLPADWVAQLWEQNFCESASLPVPVSVRGRKR